MLFCPLVQIYNKLIKVINALISTALIYVCTYTMFQILIFFFFLWAHDWIMRVQVQGQAAAGVTLTKAPEAQES